MSTEEPFKFRYLVRIAVQRTETYAVIAANEEEALASAFENGELIDGDTHSVDEISAEQDGAVCFTLDVDGQPMTVLHRKAYFGAGTAHAVDQFEFCSPHSPPRRIPVSATGYRSHFASTAEVEAFGDIRRFARREAWKLMGRVAETDSTQGGLFS